MVTAALIEFIEFIELIHLSTEIHVKQTLRISTTSICDFPTHYVNAFTVHCEFPYVFVNREFVRNGKRQEIVLCVSTDQITRRKQDDYRSKRMSVTLPVDGDT